MLLLLLLFDLTKSWANPSGPDATKLGNGSCCEGFSPRAHCDSVVEILLMEEILHQLVGSLSHYLQGLYIPGG